MTRKYSSGRNRPSWSRFFNDWKNPSSYFTGHHNSIEDDKKPVDRAKPISKQSQTKRTVNKILKPNKLDYGQKY